MAWIVTERLSVWYPGLARLINVIGQALARRFPSQNQASKDQAPAPTLIRKNKLMVMQSPSSRRLT